MLSVRATSVSGVVPASLARLTALALLDLSLTAVSGTIPPALVSLPAVRSFRFFRLSC